MIVHFDIDAFYASVAQHDDPALRGVPLAIAGESRRAVVLTASYEARPFGVRSAMPLFKARALCPTLVVSPPNFARYHEVSRAVFAIFGEGSRAVEGLSLDEAYVAVDADLPGAVRFAEEVRARVVRATGCTVSAGISAQKMVAKIASDDAKPNGLRAVEPGTERRYLTALPVGRVWGVGPKTQRRLESEGVTTIGDLAALSDERVFAFFGRGGRGVRDLARGIDDRGISSDRETRSVSSEQTFEYDVRETEELRRAVREASTDVADRLVRNGLRGSTVGVKCKRSDFRISQRQTSLADATDDAVTIERAALACLERVDLGGRAVRLLGVRVASLTAQAASQISLFAP